MYSIENLEHAWSMYHGDHDDDKPLIKIREMQVVLMPTVKWLNLLKNDYLEHTVTMKILHEVLMERNVNLMMLSGN